MYKSEFQNVKYSHANLAILNFEIHFFSKPIVMITLTYAGLILKRVC